MEDKLFNKVAFKTSTLVTKAYSTSFSIAVGMLAPETRKAIYNIYGFVRFADEIVDTFLWCNQEYLLNKFTNDLSEALSDEISMNPILHSFAITVKKYKIPLSQINSFLQSMRADLVKNTYISNSELDKYIYGSAEVVGLMCLRVFVNGNEYSYKQLEKPAMKLGAAFQKVNFLRDLKSDYEDLHRKYFPDFNKDSFDEKTKHKLIQEIEKDFREAKIGIKKLPGRSKIAVFIAYLYYKQLLRKIKKTKASEILKKRIRIKNIYKLFLFIKAYFTYKLNLI